MQNVSYFRVNLLRALYLFLVVGFGICLLPDILSSSRLSTPLDVVVNCMLLAFWLLSILGVRYPLQMLPVLLWEIVWKTLWVALVAIPQWSNGHMERFTEANLSWIPLLVICYCVVPWRYVFYQYVLKQAEPWRRAATPPSASALSVR